MGNGSLLTITWVANNYGLLTWFLLFVSAFFAMLIAGNPLIRLLKDLKGMKWSAREDTPETHLQKHGTPSMGGIGIMGASAMAFVGVHSLFVFAGLASSYDFTRSDTFSAILILPAFALVHMLLGWIDDQSKAKGGGGLRARDKFLGQCLLSIAFLVIFAYATSHALAGWRPRQVMFGYTGDTYSPIVLIVALLFLVGTCNAVNITDGIDGLAAGLCIQIGCVFALLGTTSILASQSAVAFWIALAGACLGFLIFNRYPAKVFMGDTGSLALGAAVGGAAILTHSVFLLPFIGFIFYLELISVTTQVLYFKWTRKRTGEGKRLFRRAPLHHHFELGGWSEWRVVGTFWLVNFLTSTIGLILWQQGIIPRFP